MVCRCGGGCAKFVLCSERGDTVSLVTRANSVFVVAKKILSPEGSGANDDEENLCVVRHSHVSQTKKIKVGRKKGDVKVR